MSEKQPEDFKMAMNLLTLGSIEACCVSIRANLDHETTKRLTNDLGEVYDALLKIQTDVLQYKYKMKGGR